MRSLAYWSMRRAPASAHFAAGRNLAGGAESADVEQLHPLQLALLASAIDSSGPRRRRRLRDLLSTSPRND